MDTELIKSIVISSVDELYDRSRFLDAYDQTRTFWNSSTDLSRLSVDQLILAGRLASRLGSGRICRWLWHLAYQREPENPNVRYYTHRARLRRRDFFGDLRRLEEDPLIGATDPRTEAWWLAYQSVTWATLRDFSKAESCLKRARTYLREDGWIECCESRVKGIADCWQESLNAAERSWEFSQAAPYAVNCLGTSLLNLGRLAEATRRITDKTEECQSYEIVYFACWLQCLTADWSEGKERCGALQLAKKLADRLPDLAPLADRDTRAQFVHAQFDIASLMDDHEAMKVLADQIRSPYQRWVHQQLSRKSVGQGIRLRHLHLLQKHAACLPTSIASALFTQGIELDPELMASEITFGGTPDWSAAEWLEKQGIAVRSFTVTSEVARRLIKAGIAFVICLVSDESAHAVTAIGLDESAETLLVHDPSSFRICEYLLASLEETHGPVEPLGMAMVPDKQAQLLDDLLPQANVEIATGSQNQQKELELKGVSAARRVVDALAMKYPDDPTVHFLEAVQGSVEGRSGEALIGFRKSLGIFPYSPVVRRRLLGAAKMMGNSALSKKILENVVKGELLPGVESQQNWRHPPPSYICAYADLLRTSATTRNKAKLLLGTVLVRNPTTADAWHVLGDLLAAEGDEIGRTLCYRISTCLAESDEHYALAYAYALCNRGQKQEGLAFLERRARKARTSRKAASSWVSWFESAEHWGYPEQALSVCREALTKFPDAPALLAHVIPFLSRMGLWTEAEEQMHALQEMGNLGMFCEAARDFYAMKGEFSKAIVHAEMHIREVPLSLDARVRLLELVAKHKGDPAATELAAKLLRECPRHDDFEKLYCERLSVSGPRWKKVQLLHRRVRRNPEDGWAWSELAGSAIGYFRSGNELRKEKLRPKIEHYIDECERTAPESPATIRVRALWREVLGDWEGAIELWRKAIYADPVAPSGFLRLWECSARLSGPERHKLFREIEPKLLNYPGQLSIARDLGFRFAYSFGVAAAEDALKRWCTTRPGDPEVIRAYADLLLECGQGRSDASRAKVMLKPAVERFPYHRGLRMSLAMACSAVGDHQEAGHILQEIVRRYPDETSAIVQLASGLDRQGEDSEATSLLDAASALFPLDEQIFSARVRLHVKHSRLDAVRSELQRSLRIAPDSVSLRQRAIEILLESGAKEEAISTARNGVRLYPTGAFMWLLLAKTLRAVDEYAAQGEIESCLRHSLSLNSALFEASDNLALLLVDQNRADEAEDLMQRTLAFLYDPSPAKARIATIHRQIGRKSDALKEIAAVVAAAPWYVWGWHVLLDWVTEDSKWELAKDLLRAVPPELFTNCDFRQRRLRILSKAGIPSEELRCEWESLLSEFPENLALHLECYDYFRDTRALNDAARVLKSIQPLYPENPYLLARMMDLHAQSGDLDKAADALIQIWFLEAQQGPWPADHVWSLAHRHHFEQAVYDRAKLSIASGGRLTAKAFSLMAHEAILKETKPRNEPKTSWDRLFPGAGAKELCKLLDLIDATEWANGQYRGVALGLLVDHGYQHLVIRYWCKKKGTIGCEIESRAEVARALSTLLRKEEARALFVNWRELNGVAMWMVTNYVVCFSRSDKRAWAEVRNSCSDALASLQHDHCANFLAHVLAEICAVQGDIQGFRDTWKLYRHYFSGKRKDHEWFDAIRIPLINAIPALGLFLEQKDEQGFLQQCKVLREKQKIALVQSNPLSWLWIVFWILMISSIFFR